MIKIIKNLSLELVGVVLLTLLYTIIEAITNKEVEPLIVIIGFYSWMFYVGFKQMNEIFNNKK